MLALFISLMFISPGVQVGLVKLLSSYFCLVYFQTGLLSSVVLFVSFLSSSLLSHLNMTENSSLVTSVWMYVVLLTLFCNDLLDLLESFSLEQSVKGASSWRPFFRFGPRSHFSSHKCKAHWLLCPDRKAGVLTLLYLLSVESLELLSCHVFFTLILRCLNLELVHAAARCLGWFLQRYLPLHPGTLSFFQN